MWGFSHTRTISQSFRIRTTCHKTPTLTACKQCVVVFTMSQYVSKSSRTTIQCVTRRQLNGEQSVQGCSCWQDLWQSPPQGTHCVYFQNKLSPGTETGLLTHSPYNIYSVLKLLWKQCTHVQIGHAMRIPSAEGTLAPPIMPVLETGTLLWKGPTWEQWLSLWTLIICTPLSYGERIQLSFSRCYFISE